jgi:hypothetical protein
VEEIYWIFIVKQVQLHGHRAAMLNSCRTEEIVYGNHNES